MKVFDTSKLPIHSMSTNEIANALKKQNVGPGEGHKGYLNLIALYLVSHAVKKAYEQGVIRGQIINK